jgi:hypothetical protein
VSVPVSVSVRPKATGTDPQQSTEKRTTVERRGRSILGSGALSKATREAPVRAEPHLSLTLPGASPRELRPIASQLALTLAPTLISLASGGTKPD